MCVLLHETISGFLCIISEQIFRSPSPDEINRNLSIPPFDLDNELSNFNCNRLRS